MLARTVLTERRSDDIAVVRLDRPAKRNALDTATLRLLNAALQTLAADRRLRALVLSTTDPRALCAGADVGEALDPGGALARMHAFTELYTILERFPAPVIAVCVGNCVGAGAELAAGSDLRIGGDNLHLSFAGARMGLPVGPARLTPLIGLARAKELILTGRVIGPTEADQLGLLHRVVPAAEAEAVALDLAGQVAAHPAQNLRALKQLFRDVERTGERVDAENAALMGALEPAAAPPVES